MEYLEITEGIISISDYAPPQEATEVTLLLREAHIQNLEADADHIKRVFSSVLSKKFKRAAVPYLECYEMEMGKTAVIAAVSEGTISKYLLTAIASDIDYAILYFIRPVHSKYGSSFGSLVDIVCELKEEDIMHFDVLCVDEDVLISRGIPS